MKTFSWTAGVALLAILALQGCSTNPSVAGGGSIEEFARALNGQRYSFDLAGRALTPSMSGELVTGQRIPKGLLVALAPAQERCARDGGESSFTDLQAASRAYLSQIQPAVQAQLPRRMLCLRGDAPLWSLEMQYGDVGTAPIVDPTLGTRLYLSMRIRMQLVTADQFATRLRNEEAQAVAQAVEREKAAAGRRDRQPALEQERQQRIKDRERVAAQWSTRVAAYQANLKVGDRFQWGRASIGGGPFVGMVVKVEGTLAFVQFDNLTFAGQQTRYLPKAELEPFDGPTPAGRGTID